MSKRKASNPFQIGVQKNEPMGCYDIVLMIGGLKDKKEAQAFADILAEWMVSESSTAWKARVQ
jgi:hypothetical protein